MTILVTGGAGFIGSNFIIDWLSKSNEKIINVDNLTYAGNLKNLISINRSKNYFFEKGNIGDEYFLKKLLMKYKPRAVINFAAESHVDRSINDPAKFIETNTVGTYRLLECVRFYLTSIDKIEKSNFRFIHISTDEIYGSLEKNDKPFNEKNRMLPNSPYSASKAASDHFVRAWHHTYDVPVITTNCSNNYGPFQFPEKLIPLVIVNALSGKNLPIYGDGKQIRDWIFVKDHCDAIRCILNTGIVGEVYNIGGWNEKSNLEIVNYVCSLLDKLKPKKDNTSYKKLISFVKDRPGHDKRYAIDAIKIESELGWKPSETFESGIQKTVKWYLQNLDWVKNVQDGSYRKWMKTQYG